MVTVADSVNYQMPLNLEHFRIVKMVILCLFYHNFFLNFIYFERERECEQGWGRVTGGEGIPSRLHAVSTEPDVELDPTNCEIMI